MSEFYISPEIESSEELLVRRSRFIGCVRILERQDRLTPVMQSLKKSFPSATHYCWAFRVGIENITEHCSDDGEPTGSAGRPILSAMKRVDLTQTLVCVVRYYGGLKLGVSGLIDAYGLAATKAIEASSPSARQQMELVQIKTNYQTHPVLLRKLKALGVPDSDITTQFAECVVLTISIPLTKRSDLELIQQDMQGRGVDVAFAWMD